MQADWPNGTLAEYALLPKGTLTPAEGLDQYSATELAVTMRFIVPYGGLLRGRLAPGESLAVVGATGAYGSATVLLALALGAERVVAAGLRSEPLEELKRVGGARVIPVVLTGDIPKDTAAVREAAGGGTHMTLDFVGGAKDPSSTLAGLRSLHRNGRLVLMGSMGAPIPVSYMEMMSNNWEILGNFIYPVDAYLRLLALVRGGLLDLRSIRTHTFELAALSAAMEVATTTKSLVCVVVTS
jgi:alcohol dehydrogenase